MPCNTMADDSKLQRLDSDFRRNPKPWSSYRCCCGALALREVQQQIGELTPPLS